MSDGQDIRMVSKEELHRSIAWAYKWLRRFDKDGLEGLKNKPRSGRPPDVPQEKLSKIRTELSENPSGWKAKEIMDIIALLHESDISQLNLKPSTKIE
jgi:transposase